MNQPITLNEQFVCESCGRFGAVEIGDHRLCMVCYENCGSCCLEFGGDDLWKVDEDGKERETHTAPIETSEAGA